MASLSRENTIIRLQTEVALSGIEDADQRLAVQTESLNRQLEVQRNRLRLATASWQSVTRAEGENSDNAQRARISIERERLALSRLERELRNLNETQNETNSGTSDFFAMLTKVPVFGKVAAGAAVMGGALKSVANLTKELTDNFRELQKQSYELNMPTSKTNDFLRTLRLGGGDIGDFEGFIRGITDAYVKGDIDDPEMMALDKYGAKIVDTTEKLKDFRDITEEVYQAYKKAKVVGEGVEFLQLLGGEAGMRDAMQFLERYEEAKRDNDRLFKVDIDAEALHEADKEFSVLEKCLEQYCSTNGRKNGRCFVRLAKIGDRGDCRLQRCIPREYGRKCKSCRKSERGNRKGYSPKWYATQSVHFATP